MLMAKDHPKVQPGSVWVSGTMFRVVSREGEHHVRVEEMHRLDDEPGTGVSHLVHVAWLDGGLFCGRLIKEAEEGDES